jgi:hypothetical protein
MTSPSSLVPIIVNNSVYYNATHLKKVAPFFFMGTSKGMKNIITKKSIPSSSFVYSTHSVKKGWVVCGEPPPKKASILIAKEWVVKNIPCMMIYSFLGGEGDVPENDEKGGEGDVPENDEKGGEGDVPENDEKGEYDAPEAPPLIFLKDDEKFKDGDDSPLEIETRGARKPGGVYFLALNVSNVFGILKLLHTITDSRSQYIKGVDYMLFNRPKGVGDTILSYKRTIFLTFEGMIKCLYISKSPRAKTFREWGTKILFAAKMGEQDQRIEVASNIIGQPVSVVKDVLSMCSKKISCIYRFSMGTVKHLRKKLNLPESLNDNFIVIKYGFAKDLADRAHQLTKEYKDLNGKNMGLMDFAWIDQKNISEAEVHIKNYFKDIEQYPLTYKTHTELVVIDPNYERRIRNQYRLISLDYGGGVTELVQEVFNLKKEIDRIHKNHEYELKLRDKDLECILKNHSYELKIKDKDIELSQNEITSLHKDIEIELLKKQLRG